MKYVLVIDVPEPMESEDVRIDYLCYYHCGDDIESKYDAVLKPLPPRIENVVKTYAYGWNACLDEIVGETE